MNISRSIERIDNPGEEYFRENYLKKCKPVVIKSNQNNPTQFKWTFDYLKNMVGDTLVNVYDWGEAGPTIDDDFVIKEMELRTALDLCLESYSAQSQRYAICQLPVEYLGNLHDEYEIPQFLKNSNTLDHLPSILSEQRRIAMFISFFRGMHFHNGRHAIAQQVTGSKKFFLYDPKDSRYLYPKKFWNSPISWFDQTEAVFCSDVPFEKGLENIDLKKYPKLKKSVPYEVELQAGDTLFIPSHWWHYTNANEPCVLITDFWDASISEWGWPIASRSLLMKPYRKYLYHKLMDRKRFTRVEKHMSKV
jgi:hypothetical protein